MLPLLLPLYAVSAPGAGDHEEGAEKEDGV